jgi:hypothetical protein
MHRQLSKFPRRKSFEDDFTDYPHDAEEFTTTLRGGDIVIAFVSFKPCRIDLFIDCNRQMA